MSTEGLPVEGISQEFIAVMTDLVISNNKCGTWYIVDCVQSLCERQNVHTEW